MKKVVLDYSLGDDMSETERILLHLSLGKRKPQNKHEETLLAQIKEIEANGHSVEIPAN